VKRRALVFAKGYGDKFVSGGGMKGAGGGGSTGEFCVVLLVVDPFESDD
jgi:hypothetical protein